MSEGGSVVNNEQEIKEDSVDKKGIGEVKIKDIMEGVSGPIEDIIGQNGVLLNRYKKRSASRLKI